jgi:hypothetical protein
MTSITRALDADMSANLEAKRKWVREHYQPEAQHKYETLEGKLSLLRTIVYNKWIAPDETLNLQCLGVTFGDALAQVAELKWVVVEDEYGKDPALVVDGASIKVFPLTMISKRIEAGEDVDVLELFKVTWKTIERVRSEG